MSLPETLERAASELSADADQIRPANGDPFQLLETLDAQAATRLLTWLLVHEPEAGAELATAWSEEEAGQAPLQAIVESDLPKPGRKVLRRALHRLRARGVEIASRESEAVVARLPELEDHFEMACVSGVDPSGTILVFLIEPEAAGGARVFDILLSETRGVVDFQAVSTSRSKARKFMRQLEHENKAGAVPIDSAAVRALVSRAVARQPSDRALPRTFANWRSRLTTDDPKAQTPGEAVRDALEVEPGLSPLKRAEELVRDGTLGPWPPHTDRLRELTSLIRERAEGRVLLSEGGERERVDSALGVAAESLFVDEFAQCTKARFLHSAYVLWKSGKDEDARGALAGAAAFDERAPGDNPIAKALLEIVVGPALEAIREPSEASESEKAEAEEDEGSIIIKP